MFAFVFFRNRNRYEQIRQIYGPLDCLGDIGGLFDALVGIGAAFMYVCQLMTSSHLNSYLLMNIFEQDNSCKFHNTTN